MINHVCKWGERSEVLSAKVETWLCSQTLTTVWGVSPKRRSIISSYQASKSEDIRLKPAKRGTDFLQLSAQSQRYIDFLVRILGLSFGCLVRHSLCTPVDSHEHTRLLSVNAMPHFNRMGGKNRSVMRSACAWMHWSMSVLLQQLTALSYSVTIQHIHGWAT